MLLQEIAKNKIFFFLKKQSLSWSTERTRAFSRRRRKGSHIKGEDSAHFWAKQWLRHPSNPSPSINITNKAKTSSYKMSLTFSPGGWNQLSCSSLTNRAVCCPPLDAISTARFSSCFPVIFTGLHSSSSSPVPSCRFVPIPQAYTDPGIKSKKNKSAI